MIYITADTSLICEEAWDYPLEEIGYLIETYPGETFVLKDGRLWETDYE